ncbi:MAG: hypothetical protein ABEJ89_02810 [Haloarculaceae archaeon]
MTYNTIDKAAMALSGGLMLLGIVGLGILEVLAGQPYGAAPVEITNDAGEVVNTLYPLVGANIRTGLVIAGVLVMLVYAIYKLIAQDVEVEAVATNEQPAD